MEILKVGDELALSGYKAITLADDMSQNIAEFAEVNGVSEAEAQRILYTSPALREFVDSLDSQDAEDDIVLLGDFVDDTEEINAIAKAGAGATIGKAGSDNKPEVTYTLNGVSFKIIQNGTSTPSCKTSGKNKVIITGKDIEIEILSCTNDKAVVETNGSNLKLTSTAHVKQIINNAKDSEIIGSSKADDIVNKGDGSTIRGGSGNDKIKNTAKNTTIYGDAGNDTIKNTGKKATIDGGAGYDTIKSTGKDSKVENAEVGDQVTSNKNTTINRNFDDVQTISVGGIKLKVTAKNSNSTFSYKESSTTVKIDGKNTKVPVITITANKCRIEIASASNANTRVVLKGKGNELNSTAKVGMITNYDNTAKIVGSDEKDKIVNYGSYATIDAGAGNDKITNKSAGFGATIIGGIGNDTITNEANSKKVNGTSYHVTISGGAGNDTINNSGKGAVIDVRDGDDTVNQTKNVASTVTGVTDNDKITGKTDKVNIKLFASSIKAGEIGSIEYAISKISGLTRSAVKEYETDSQGRVIALYLDNKAQNVYRIGYGSAGLLQADGCPQLSNVSLTITHEVNHKTTQQIALDASGKKVHQYDRTEESKGEVITSTLYDDAEQATSKITTGKANDGTIRYTLKNNAVSSDYPTIETTASQLKISFNDNTGTARTLTIKDGETVEITKTNDTEFTVKVTKKDGTSQEYTCIKPQEGATAIGSKEYLQSLDSTLNMDNATDIERDSQGRITAFQIGNRRFRVQYNGTTVSICNSSLFGLNSGEELQPASYSENRALFYDGQDYILSIYENGKLASRTTEAYNLVDGVLVEQHTSTIYNTSTGRISEENTGKTFRNSDMSMIGGYITRSLNYDANGVPQSVETKGEKMGEDGELITTYTIQDQLVGNGYPKFTDGNATQGKISFSSTKTINVPFTDGATTASAVIAADGKVTVTETLADGGTKVTNFDRNGNEIGDIEITHPTEHHDVEGGSYDHSETTVGDQTTHSYVGHTTEGTQTFSITGLNTSVATVSVSDAQHATITFCNTNPARTVQIGNGDSAVFGADGKLTVRRQDGTTEVYRTNGTGVGTMESRTQTSGNTTTEETFRENGTVSERTVTATADGTTTTTHTVFKADGTSRESETVIKRDSQGNRLSQVTRENFNNDGSFTETIKGFSDNKEYYSVTYKNNGSEYPQFDPSANSKSLQIHMSASESFSITNGSSVTISNDGKTAVVTQTNGVIRTYTLDAAGNMTMTTNVSDLTPPEITLPDGDGEDTNTNTNKNLLGMFGLSADSRITEGPTERTATETNIYGETVNVKIVEIKVNGKTYTAKLDAATGELLETKENGTVKYQKEIDQVKLKTYQLEIKKQELANTLWELLANYHSRKSLMTEINNSIKWALENFNGETQEDLLNAIKANLFSLGINSGTIDSAWENDSFYGNTLRNEFGSILTLSTELANAEAEEAAKPNKIVTKTVNGLSFKIEYPKNGTEPTITYNASTKTYTVSGSNCKIEVLGYGEQKDANIVIENGSNIEFSSSFTRFNSITNKVDGAKITGSAGNDNIINEAANAIIDAGDGNDTVNNSGANATINGGAGKDNITNSGANTTINGGAGDDMISNTGNGSTISGGNGDDIIRNNGSNVTINGNAGNDQIENRGSNTTINGNAGDDRVINYGDGAKIYGNDGDDTIYHVNGTVSEMDAEHKIKFLRDPNHWLDSDSASDCAPIEPETPPVEPPVVPPPVDPPVVPPVVPPGNSDDPNYTYMQTFTKNGITFNFYSNTEITEDPSSLAEQVVTINASNCKIVVTANTNPNAGIRLEQGNTNIDFQTNVRLASICNWANKTNITGSDANDTIINYGNEVEILGGNGDDAISNEGSSVTIAGGDGADRIQIWKGTNVSVNTDRYDDYNDYTNQAQCTGEGCHASQPATADTIKTYMSSSTLTTALGLSSSEFTTFISHYYGKDGYDSYEKVLELFKQIEVIYENSDKDSQTIASIKACMTGSSKFNNEILADASIILKAQEAGAVGSAAYKASIKSQMVKDGKSNAAAGDVYKENGNLYYRTGTGSNDYVQLEISEDTYLELFEPVKRFIVEQGSSADCFLLSSAMVDCMENVQARGSILKMFKEENGNIIVKIPGVSQYPVTFDNGDLKTTTGIVSSAKGLQMLEQAYALAKFAEVIDSGISNQDITDLHSAELAAAVRAAKANSALRNNIEYAMKFYVGGWFTGNGDWSRFKDIKGVLNDLFPNTSSSNFGTIGTSAASLKSVADVLPGGNYVITATCQKVSTADAAKYNLSSKEAHQLSIESIDMDNKIVYVRNPWDSYRLTPIPFADFERMFSSIDYRKLS
ncbi:MAG: calcium-binding protein [bacterium]|nr:calcium-binding protein [bacterium]